MVTTCGIRTPDHSCPRMDIHRVAVTVAVNWETMNMDEPGLCTARWATANQAHREGDLCGEPAAERLGDIDLCAHHYGRALDWFYKCHVPEAPERMEAARREASERARLIAEERSIVYYLRRESDGLIKIGFSTNYPSRLNTLRAEHGPLRLLLATAGGRVARDRPLHLNHPPAEPVPPPRLHRHRMPLPGPEQRLAQPPDMLPVRVLNAVGGQGALEVRVQAAVAGGHEGDVPCREVPGSRHTQTRIVC